MTEKTDGLSIFETSSNFISYDNQQNEKQSASTPTEKEAKTTEKHLPTTAKQANNGSFTRETEAREWYMERK